MKMFLEKTESKCLTSTGIPIATLTIRKKVEICKILLRLHKRKENQVMKMDCEDRKSNTVQAIQEATIHYFR